MLILESIVKLVFLFLIFGKSVLSLENFFVSPHEKLKSIRRQLLTALDPFSGSSINVTATSQAIEKSDETAWQWGFWPFTAIPDDNTTVVMVPPDQK